MSFMLIGSVRTAPTFMPQVKDESKWGTAALLAKRLIKGSEAGSFKYKLHTVERKLDTKPLPENVPDENYPNGAGGIDALRSYAFYVQW